MIETPATIANKRPRGTNLFIITPQIRKKASSIYNRNPNNRPDPKKPRNYKG